MPDQFKEINWFDCRRIGEKLMGKGRLPSLKNKKVTVTP